MLLYVLYLILLVFGYTPAQNDIYCAGVKIDNAINVVAYDDNYLIHFSFDDTQAFVIVSCANQYNAFQVDSTGVNVVDF